MAPALQINNEYKGCNFNPLTSEHYGLQNDMNIVLTIGLLLLLLLNFFMVVHYTSINWLLTCKPYFIEVWLELVWC